MKTRQAQEIVRRAKAIGYKYSFVRSGLCGKYVQLCDNKQGEYCKVFNHYESAIEWLEMMEEPEVACN